MTRWPTTPLRELIVIRKGRKASKMLAASTGTSVRYLQIEDLRPDPTLKYCEPFDCPIASRTDVVIAWDGANAGTASSGLEGHIGSTLAILRPLPNSLHTGFLSRFIQAKFDYLQSTATGATIPHVSKEALLGLAIPLPPIEEQERVSNLLEEADKLRGLGASADRRTRGMMPALFSEVFGAMRNVPSVTVAEIAVQRRGSIRTGPFGSALLHSEFADEGVPVLGIDNVVENEFRWAKVRCISQARFEELRQFQVMPDDVLITIMGTVGRCVVAPSDLPVCLSTKHLCVITVDRGRVNPRYLWGALLFDDQVRRQTRAVGKGAIMEGWNAGIVKRLRIGLPPLAAQDEFAARVEECRAFEGEQLAGRERLRELFAALSHNAFQGDL